MAFSGGVRCSQGAGLAGGGRGSYLTAVLDHRIVLWPVSEEGQGLVLSGHAVRVIEMAYNADESQAASVDADGVVIVWDLSTGAGVQRIQLEVSRAVPSASLVFHPRGEWLVAHGKGANILFWSVVSGELIHSIKVARHGVLDLDISDDGARLAVGTSYAGRYDQNRTQRQGRGEYDPQALTSGPALVFDLTGLWH